MERIDVNSHPLYNGAAIVNGDENDVSEDEVEKNIENAIGILDEDLSVLDEAGAPNGEMISTLDLVPQRRAAKKATTQIKKKETVIFFKLWKFFKRKFRESGIS